MSPATDRLYDALIVGGGPAGAASAILLATAGWAVAVVEKARFPRRKVCGEFIAAATLPLFAELGVADAFGTLGGPPVREVGVYAGDRQLRAAMPASNPGQPWGRALGRDRLDALLLDRAAAAGAEVWQPWVVTGSARQDDGHLCRLKNREGEAERSLRTRLIIDAGGSWSPGSIGTPAAAPRVRTDGGKADLLAFKARFVNTGLPAGLMPLLAFPGGYGGLVHSDGGRVSLSCCVRRDRLQACRRLPLQSAGDAVLAHILWHCAGAREVLSGATAVDSWLGAGPIRPGVRSAYRDGIFKVGNAAGEAHPVVAEGISMAVQGAWMLADVLVRGREEIAAGRIDAVGRAYGRAWRSAFVPRIRFAAVCAGLAMRPTLAAGMASLLQRHPALLTHCARLSGKTTAPGARKSIFARA